MENLQESGVAYLISIRDKTMQTFTSVHEVALWILHNCKSLEMEVFMDEEDLVPVQLTSKDGEAEMLIPFRTVNSVRNELFYLLSI